MNRQEWLEARKKGLGGSDIAGIFSLPPYGCARYLWMDKKSIPEDFPNLNRRIMDMGNRLEHIVVEDYVEETGNEVSPGAELTPHPEHSFLVANTDGTIKDEYFSERGYGILECKTAGKDAYFKMMKEGVNESYVLQMQAYLYVLDLKWGAFAVLLAGNPWYFQTFEVTRDEKLIKVIVDAATKFWDGVQNDDAPDRLDIKDARCKKCTRRKTCWGEKLEEIEAVQEESGALDLSEDDKYLQALDDHEAANLLLAEGKSQKEAAAKVIQDLMKDQGVAFGGGHKVYWKVQNKTGFDAKAFKEDNPTLAKKYEKKSKSRPFRIF